MSLTKLLSQGFWYFTLSQACKIWQDPRNPAILTKMREIPRNSLRSALRPDQFNFQEHGFFSKFKGSVGRKKKENKKNSQFFALALIINKNVLQGKPCIYSDFLKFAFKKCQYVEINMTLKQKYICARFIKHLYLYRNEFCVIK